VTDAPAVAARDERRHTPGPEPGWCEVFTWEAEPPPPQPAVTIRLVLHPDRAWYLAAVVVPDRPLIVVTDLDVPLPSSPASLELRTSGLWADHNVETPLAHVSVGLEAFGVALDDPADALADGFGVRTPVGFDLEWEDDRPPVPDPSATAYEVPGRAHGEVLVGTEAFEIDGPGQWAHAWGPVDWSAPSWRASVRWADGSHTVARHTDEAATVELHRDDWGLPVAGHLEAGSRVCTVEPEVCVPVVGPGVDLVSALVVCRDRAGSMAGRGWIELIGGHHGGHESQA
jgi:hypothetical protein